MVKCIFRSSIKFVLYISKALDEVVAHCMKVASRKSNLQMMLKYFPNLLHPLNFKLLQASLQITSECSIDILVQEKETGTNVLGSMDTLTSSYHQRTSHTDIAFSNIFNRFRLNTMHDYLPHILLYFLYHFVSFGRLLEQE